jgi:hypothetical protein
MQITEHIIETYTRLTCSECGVFFFLSDHVINTRRDDGKSFYCTNGHQQCYIESETKRLRRQLEATQNELRGAKCDVIRAKNERDEEAKAKDKALRKLKRVTRGVCPECNRTFTDLARHMECKHGIKPQLLLAEKIS